MVNTYGFHSINSNTFNTRYHEVIEYPRTGRNYVVTGFRINNAVLNILGYIPGVSFFSGTARMTLGVGIIAFTLIFGQRNIDDSHMTTGAIIGRWYDEAILTGIAQIARGALEAFIPYGRLINAILDVVATPFNCFAECNPPPISCDCESHRIAPYPDVDYPLPFQILKLA